MKKRKSVLVILAIMIITVLSLGLMACGDKKLTNAPDEKITAVYNAYVAYAESEGATPLSYEDWLASIKGIDGINGTNGKSAYEIAVENGFDGTVAAWLESLKGEPAETHTHIWEDTGIKRESTLEEAGVKLWSCTRCGMVKAEYLPLLERYTVYVLCRTGEGDTPVTEGYVLFGNGKSAEVVGGTAIIVIAADEDHSVTYSSSLTEGAEQNYICIEELTLSIDNSSATLLVMENNITAAPATIKAEGNYSISVPQLPDPEISGKYYAGEVSVKFAPPTTAAGVRYLVTVNSPIAEYYQQDWLTQNNAIDQFAVLDICLHPGETSEIKFTVNKFEPNRTDAWWYYITVRTAELPAEGTSIAYPYLLKSKISDTPKTFTYENSDEQGITYVRWNMTTNNGGVNNYIMTYAEGTVKYKQHVEQGSFAWNSGAEVEMYGSDSAVLILENCSTIELKFAPKLGSFDKPIALAIDGTPSEIETAFGGGSASERWFKIELEEAAVLHVAVSNPQSGIGLYDEDGKNELINSSMNSGSFDWNFEANKVYYVKIDNNATETVSVTAQPISDLEPGISAYNPVVISSVDGYSGTWEVSGNFYWTLTPEIAGTITITVNGGDCMVKTADYKIRAFTGTPTTATVDVGTVYEFTATQYAGVSTVIITFTATPTTESEAAE